MSEIIGNASNIHIARMLGVLRVSHLGDEICYKGEDYIHDLNAMHEAEKKLTKEQWIVYEQNLDRIGAFPMVHATAEQRAEAFIKTMDNS